MQSPSSPRQRHTILSFRDLFASDSNLVSTSRFPPAAKGPPNAAPCPPSHLLTTVNRSDLGPVPSTTDLRPHRRPAFHPHPHSLGWNTPRGAHFTDRTPSPGNLSRSEPKRSRPAKPRNRGGKCPVEIGTRSQPCAYRL